MSIGSGLSPGPIYIRLQLPLGTQYQATGDIERETYAILLDSGVCMSFHARLSIYAQSTHKTGKMQGPNFG
jgi:hypothetical protein